MLNPITEKLGKLFNKNKRSKLRTEADTPLKLYSRSFLRATDKENDSHLINRLNESALTPWKSTSVGKNDHRSEAIEQDYERVMRDNDRLK
jgi:hypothetical protein